MPELPEVETVVNFLAPTLIGKTCSRISVPTNYHRALSGKSAVAFTKKIKDKKIIRVFRRAKYIILELSESGYITIHLRMTGRLLDSALPEDKKYITAWITFSDNTALYFKDVRKFGKIDFLPTLEPLENKLGPEPLSSELTVRWLKQKLANSGRRMKALLLDQSFVAGLGNIYVDEVLFKAGIHPEQTAATVSDKQITALHRAIRRTISDAIACNGTTFQSFYFGEEQSGEYVDFLQIFGREGKPCTSCKTEVIKLRVSGRGTHICPNCQRL